MDCSGGCAEESSPTEAKAAAMLVLGAGPLVLGLLPWAVVRAKRGPESPWGRLTVSLLLCFGGGVLLCTTFLHMQPEVREAVHHLQDSGLLPSLPLLPELFLFAGFFLVYLVEEMAHAWVHGSAIGGAAQDAVHRTVGARRCSTASVMQENEGPALRPTVKEVPSLKGLLAVLALSFHAVFEGLAVGLESDASSVWVLCGAIAAHKLVIAFCVGVELVSARTRPALLLAYVATFAMVTPLGIGAGIAVTASQGLHDAATTTDPGASVAVVVLQGMAAGTLIYVVFFEVLQRGGKASEDGEDDSPLPGPPGRASGLVHLLAALCGFLATYGLLHVGATNQRAEY
ncbi:zinc transporter ZIP1-like [Ischnura elegans]|uniref:zinc transporter ZIP1-like n=1 Tax=Ischnura elegans TaxID=197161 RepID=UPI001ED8BC28|nr:zinc transporter ZIP1-like [Ischnura elegans]